MLSTRNLPPISEFNTGGIKYTSTKMNARHQNGALLQGISFRNSTRVNLFAVLPNGKIQIVEALHDPLNSEPDKLTLYESLNLDAVQITDSVREAETVEDIGDVINFMVLDRKRNRRPHESRNTLCHSYNGEDVRRRALGQDGFLLPETHIRIFSELETARQFVEQKRYGIDKNVSRSTVYSIRIVAGAGVVPAYFMPFIGGAVKVAIDTEGPILPEGKTVLVSYSEDGVKFKEKHLALDDLLKGEGVMGIRFYDTHQEAVDDRRRPLTDYHDRRLIMEESELKQDIQFHKAALKDLKDQYDAKEKELESELAIKTAELIDDFIAKSTSTKIAHERNEEEVTRVKKMRQEEIARLDKKKAKLQKEIEDLKEDLEDIKKLHQSENEKAKREQRWDKAQNGTGFLSKVANAISNFVSFVVGIFKRDK